MEWKVELIGESSDLSALSQMPADVDFSIVGDGEGYVMMSSAFESTMDADAVREKAQRIVDLLDGAIHLALEATAPIRIGSVYRVREDGSRDFYVAPAPFRVEARVFAPTVVITHPDGASEEFHPADPVRVWVRIAQNDKSVAAVFVILANMDPNWSDLYKVLEIVREDVGGLDAVASAGWATKSSMNLFTRTANSVGAIGLDARHGVETTQPPSNPMNFSEARSLIKTIVHGWLRFKSSA